MKNRKNINIYTITAAASIDIPLASAYNHVASWTAAQNETITVSGQCAIGDMLTLYITDSGGRTITFDATKGLYAPTFTGINGVVAVCIFKYDGSRFILQSQTFTGDIKTNFSYTTGAPGTTVTTAVIIKAAAAGLKNYIKNIQVSSASTTSTRFDILDGVTVIASYIIAGNLLEPIEITFPDGFGTSVNSALGFQMSTAPTGGNVWVNAFGYQGY